MTDGRDHRSGRMSGRDRRRRTLSQNLLWDSKAIDAFVEAVPTDGELPGVEVGAGDGALTVKLAERLPALTAYEFDPVLVVALRSRLRSHPSVRIVHGDFLSSPSPEETFRLVGNAPFGVTTAIVTWALRSPTLATATLITQLEYARKRTGDYGRWTLTTIRTWPWYDWRLVGRISRRSFRPMPAVDAGILHLVRRADPMLPAGAAARWTAAVECGFRGVGGSLRASLGTVYPPRQVNQVFSQARIDPNIVVGLVAPPQWLRLFRDLEGL